MASIPHSKANNLKTKKTTCLSFNSMASIQHAKPANQTNHPIQGPANDKPKNETCYQGSNEHKFTNKVKEKVNSARKILTEHIHNEHHTHQDHTRICANHRQQLMRRGSDMAYGDVTEKKNKEGHAFSCMPKKQHLLKKNKNRKEGENNNKSSSSSSESNDDTR
ncbi:unnamed protein product [Ilex paraguariensis]|uniref:Uncharacterized protein n=1 Tax=Ilex paraguariensis TaxID=185542 RepID=A0ABC8T0T2_9AQUA